MPPKQCPACGRFLQRTFIEALGATSALCPHCEGTLTASMFGGAVQDGSQAPDVAEVSVRPPDLEPDAVRDRTLDVLAGWDAGVSDAEVAAWREDRRPFPSDTVAVVGAGSTGLVLGLLLVPQHRVRGAAWGALSGVVGSALVRRIWLLRA